jgi:hypothetical protein
VAAIAGIMHNTPPYVAPSSFLGGATWLGISNPPRDLELPGRLYMLFPHCSHVIFFPVY